MIRLSRIAQAQVRSLTAYYDDLDRPAAVSNLRACVANAGLRIEARRGPFFAAPRPYPGLHRSGWLWLKEGPYWVAYKSESFGAVVQVVFHEAADMPNRM